mmetsp:Transcript_14223/g.46413  ORF Transcript_14223/g.46413 Transcript_14223/m.46413 type:complete len:300 (-) Transcript_14223:95-994(-)
MGNQVSVEEAGSVGYRVLGVQAKSPASECGLVSFFDFVVAAGGTELRELDSTFIDKIKASEDEALLCTIYNIKSKTTREVSIIPKRNWGGQGLLGVTIRFDTYFKADEHLVRVLDVERNSPAFAAGLKAETDYILGTAETVFPDSDALTQACLASLDSRLDVYVYNVDDDQVRVVPLVPTRNWGGHGCLGAAVAHGYLHRLPARCRSSLGNSVESDLWPVHPRAKDAMRDHVADDATLPHPPGVTVTSAAAQAANNNKKALPGGMEREPSSDSAADFVDESSAQLQPSPPGGQETNNST